jgi:TolA-binding protein
MPPVCLYSARDEIFEGYVRGTLGAEQRDAFEDHYFACAACLARVRAYDGLHAELGRLAADPLPEPAVPQRRARWWVPATAAACLVVVAAVAFWVRSPAPVPPGNAVAVAPAPQPPAAVAAPQAPTATPPAAAQRQARAVPSQSGPVGQPATQSPGLAPAPVVALSVLARVEPPPYAPVALRGPHDEAAAKFDDAMRRYVKRDHTGALPGLSAAAGLKPDVPQYVFFLAVCQLLTGHLDPAVAGLRKTIALGESPYLEEAHFYLAKARLRQGDVQAAREELAKAIDRHGRIEDDARRLLAQLDALPQRR